MWTLRQHVSDGVHTNTTTEPSMCGGDATFLSNYFDHLLLLDHIACTTFVDAVYRVAQKIWHSYFVCLNFTKYCWNQFSKLFHDWNQQKIFNNTVTKDPTTPKCVATLPWEMSSVLKATIENKTTSVTTHLKKLTTRNNVFIASVIDQSNCHILQFLHQMFNVSSLLLDNALKPATPLTNGAISGVTGLSASSNSKANILNI